MLRGRVVAREGARVRVQHAAGADEITVTGAPPALGDLVEIDRATGACTVATPFRGDPATGASWARHVLDPRRQRGLAVRAQVEAGVHAFFAARDFVETRTPVRVPCPGLEPHLKPFALAGGRHYLHTSPELAMKRLLVGGLERIYQLAPVFRDEPHAPTHLPEFTMLEWYRAWQDEHAIMDDVEELVAELATELYGEPRVGELDLTPPWPRLRVRDLFLRCCGVDPLPWADLRGACLSHGLGVAPDDTWDDLYFRLWLGVIEPSLPADRPVIVERYPASQAALAVVDADADRTEWARRFEVYAGGLELGNAFYELTDPALQRARFEADIALRQRAHPDWPAPPVDEGFLAALAEGLPPSAGIAVGVDRLVMLLAGESDISYTTWLAY